MKKLWIAAGCAWLLTAAQQVQALWSVAEVSPASPSVADRTFSVTTKPDQPVPKVRILVTPAGKRPLSPYLSGYVWLHDGDRFLGEIRVEEQREGESSVFVMKLDPKVARHSHFEVHETSYHWKKGQTTRPARVDPSPLELRGGSIFRLDLGKFLAADQAG